MESANKGVAPRAPEAEVRQVTVMKCDIVGSTRIKRGLDMDGQLTFMRGLEGTIGRVAARHAGHVERFEGDGAMIFFGYPDAREDAAESAVRMGLDIVDTIRSAHFLAGVQLQIRVGIASGSVAVVRQIPEEKGESVAGLIIDMAERLRAHAEPDQVVIADATKRLAAGFFEYDDLGIVQVKGFEEGVRAWRAVRESSVVSRFEAHQSAESQDEIIGRSDALASLSQAWSDALTGKGQAVCLVGDAGMGKSRLARIALDRAARDGATAIKIDCMPSTGNTPLFPIGVLLRRLAHITASTSPAGKTEAATRLLSGFLTEAEVAAALGYLAPLFGLEAAPIPVDHTPEQVRDQTILAVVRMIRALAALGPLAMLCEDLHWADDTTATVVQRVANEVASLRALMIVTSRTDADYLPNLQKAATVLLQPLDAANAADLVRSVAKGAALSADVVQGIVDRCEGVPLLLEEVTRNALEAASGGEEVRTDAPHGGSVPTLLRLVVESRLGRSPSFRSVAQAASVLGREFSIRVLEQMVPRDQGTHVADAVNVFARHGLFAPWDSGAGDRVRFKHVMICEAVHDMLLGEDRKHLHSDAADILRTRYSGTPDASPDVVAEHLRMAERFVEAIETRLAASADTAARGAYVETEGHCEAALRLIEHVRDPEQKRELQFKLLVQLGVALTAQHGYASAKVEHAYRRAQVVCGESAEAVMLYPIMRGLATVNLVRGNLAAAYELSLRGLNLAERSNRVEFRIDAMSVHSYTTLYFGRLEECRSWIEQCLKLYREAHGEGLTYPVPQDAGTAALALLPTAAWLLGDPEGAEDAIREGLAHVERLQRDFDKALLNSWTAGTRYTQRRYSECRNHARITADTSQRHGYQEWHGYGILMGLLAEAAQKPSPDAVDEATRICTAYDQEGVGLNASYYLWGLARGHARAGNVRAARIMLEQAFKKAEESRESRMIPELLILEAELESDAAEALVLLTRALHVADEQGAVANSLRAAAEIVRRSTGDAAALDHASATLEFLDGRTPYPPQRDWMHRRLADLRRSIRAQTGAAARK